MRDADDLPADDLLADDLLAGDLLADDLLADDLEAEDFPPGDLAADDFAADDLVAGDLLAGFLAAGMAFPWFRTQVDRYCLRRQVRCLQAYGSSNPDARALSAPPRGSRTKATSPRRVEPPGEYATSKPAYSAA